MNAAENIRAPGIDVVVESALWDAQADATVRRAIEEAATALGADFRNHTLAVLLTDDAAVRRLNAQWRGIDADLIDAVFYFVADDAVVRPQRIFDEAELVERWRAGALA